MAGLMADVEELGRVVRELKRDGETYLLAELLTDAAKRRLRSETLSRDLGRMAEEVVKARREADAAWMEADAQLEVAEGQAKEVARAMALEEAQRAVEARIVEVRAAAAMRLGVNTLKNGMRELEQVADAVGRLVAARRENRQREAEARAEEEARREAEAREEEERRELEAVERLWVARLAEIEMEVEEARADAAGWEEAGEGGDEEDVVVIDAAEAEMGSLAAGSREAEGGLAWDEAEEVAEDEVCQECEEKASPPAARVSPARGDGTDCVVCFDAAMTHAFVPCGHRCACEPCAKRIMSGVFGLRCPICRAECDMTLRIYDHGR